MKNHIKDIKKKVDRLNRIIDLKIIRGQSYKKESALHKDLITYLKSYAK